MVEQADAPHYSFEFVPAPDDLARYINSLFVLRVGADGVREMLPAYSGQLLLFVDGAGRMDFGDGFEDSPGQAFCTAPLSSALPFEIDGPAFLLGVSMNFHGWAAFTGLPVTQHSDCFVSLDKAFGGSAANQLGAISDSFDPGSSSTALALDRMAAILRNCLTPLTDRHFELIEHTYRWLSSNLDPDSDELYANIDLSKRQVQRLVKRFFGASPSRLKRRYRAIRAATLLADPKLDKAGREEVLDAFYDQAHLIREIREFTGRTPRLLSKAQANLIGDTLGHGGYGVKQMFAGEVEVHRENERKKPS